MNDLQKHLDQLIAYFLHWSKPSPSWSRILIVEDTNIKYGKVRQIPRSVFKTLGEYAARFDAHLNAGHSWINMNAAGILDDTLLVLIELPSYVNDVPRDKVSVNYSGPLFEDGQPQWDLTGRVEITG